MSLTISYCCALSLTSAGIFAIGTGLPTCEAVGGGTASTLLPGFSGTDDNIWTFVFQDASNIWAAYSNEDAVSPACVGGIAHYVLSGGVWAIDAATSPCADSANPIYSITGRYESGSWVVYATSVDSLYRYVSGGSYTKIASPASHRYFRSVAVAPVQLPTPTPTPTPSSTKTPTNTPCPTNDHTPPAPGDIVVVRLGDYPEHDFGTGYTYPGAFHSTWM